jgi:two-component system NtrC family sensor kinase
LELAGRLNHKEPALPIILLTSDAQEAFPVEALHVGIVDWLRPPLRSDAILETATRGLGRRKRWQEWLNFEARSYTGPLQKQVDRLEVMAKVGRSITSRLDLDEVLTTVVETAVELTGAEEGSILLLDEESGELYMRAARNFQDEFVQTFRLPVQDSLAGQVLSSSKPVIIDQQSPEKIKTSYLVHSLIYWPLIAHNRVIGILGIDNRTVRQSFQPEHLTLLSALAEFAAIAIENARLYSNTEVELKKLETILTQIKDGIIVLDAENRPILVNRTVRDAFDLGDQDLSEVSLEKAFYHESLLQAFRGDLDVFFRIEIEIGERVYNVQVTELPEIGTVATLHDISYLKELDRIKTDFINTISHDLRSPLTAILGYVDLIKRVGEVNQQQDEFIQRVQSSVHNITDLISNLLDLGRIEFGLDLGVEPVSLLPLVSFTLDNIQSQVDKKEIKVHTDIQEPLPHVLGNATQLRQMIDNLFTNAVKYTLSGGDIKVKAYREHNHVIMQVMDNGIGIPLEEQSRVFDRFFRARNVSDDIRGTGLGLAIVKSIVDNHNGRVWVDSREGLGSRFTVMLPVNRDINEIEAQE